MKLGNCFMDIEKSWNMCIKASNFCLTIVEIHSQRVTGSWGHVLQGPLSTLHWMNNKLQNFFITSYTILTVNHRDLHHNLLPHRSSNLLSYNTDNGSLYSQWLLTNNSNILFSSCHFICNSIYILHEESC